MSAGMKDNAALVSAACALIDQCDYCRPNDDDLLQKCPDFYEHWPLVLALRGLGAIEEATDAGALLGRDEAVA